MELSFNTSDQVFPQIDAASHVPYMLLQSLAFLFMSDKLIRVDPLSNFTVKRTLSTHRTMPSQTDRPRGFHHRVLSSLWTQVSSTFPTKAWVRIRLLSKLFVSVLGTVDLPTNQSRTTFLALHVVNTFQFQRFIHFNL